MTSRVTPLALCFAAAGSRVASSGGPYSYVDAAFGPLPGFVAGALMWICNIASSAGVAAALADLLQQESLPAFERRIKRYLQPQLLILDELGYLPCDSRAADLLYNVISRRHEHRSTIITTNLAFKQWGTVFPGAACVGALVDRFAQHCHCIDIDADSWRNRHGIERDQAPASPSLVKPR